MTHSILDLSGTLVEVAYTKVEDCDGALPMGDLFLPLAGLHRLAEVQGKKGLWFAAGETPEDHPELPLDQLDWIAIEFSNFNDGRGYSVAHLLRRNGFKGDLLAVGDVFKDVMFYLKRSGFTLFEVKDVAAEAKGGLTTFTTPYQASTAEAKPNYQAGQQQQ